MQPAAAGGGRIPTENRRLWARTCPSQPPSDKAKLRQTSAPFVLAGCLTSVLQTCGWQQKTPVNTGVFRGMVPTTGLEPVRCYSLEPESSASANSATWATPPTTSAMTACETRLFSKFPLRLAPRLTSYSGVQFPCISGQPQSFSRRSRTPAHGAPESSIRRQNRGMDFANSRADHR